MSFPKFNTDETKSKKELEIILEDLQKKHDSSNSPLHKPIIKVRIDRITNLIKTNKL